MKPSILTMMALALLLSSCNEVADHVTKPSDYNSYLDTQENEMLQLAEKDLIFWENKLEKEPGQFPYLAKAAASLSLMFKETGRIDYLKEAELKLVEVNERTNYGTSGYLRALAGIYIAQHRFKEALKLLHIAEIHGEKLKATQNMLFDVHLELGNTHDASMYLKNIENYIDFDFLIRLSKWSDHHGDLDKAILYLKKASEIAESSNDQQRMQWTYTNLADYYGHDGQINLSYHFYLKALALHPNDAYAIKGIAWIVYSHERNPQEALRILNAISKTHETPDIYLFKAEIAEYIGDNTAKKEYLNNYRTLVKDTNYGAMYNTYNALLFTDTYHEPKRAATIALEEIKDRPTPQSYDLLAWAYYNHGHVREALQIMEEHVADKTFEPDVLFHLAQIYKGNGKVKEASALKKELLDSTFELGPLMEEKIEKI
ncbi:tetratricopeptide repeat protein [Aestuariivivens sediminis]|uniref:tetratricopeptide repeat protein n=1 Tax=Aestuariivivens sediminis TaxID=2913557 RepID=UPI001F592B53|nr:cell surface protein [Aestuariivivens sediminis]